LPGGEWCWFLSFDGRNEGGGKWLLQSESNVHDCADEKPQQEEEEMPALQIGGKYWIAVEKTTTADWLEATERTSDLWLWRPTQLPMKGQWWSMRRVPEKGGFTRTATVIPSQF
jgi:hypothetical protein